MVCSHIPAAIPRHLVACRNPEYTWLKYKEVQLLSAGANGLTANSNVGVCTVYMNSCGKRDAGKLFTEANWTRNINLYFVNSHKQLIELESSILFLTSHTSVPSSGPWKPDCERWEARVYDKASTWGRWCNEWHWKRFSSTSVFYGPVSIVGAHTCTHTRAHTFNLLNSSGFLTYHQV